jgi:hypothetical protein
VRSYLGTKEVGKILVVREHVLLQRVLDLEEKKIANPTGGGEERSGYCFQESDLFINSLYKKTSETVFPMRNCHEVLY